MNNQNYRQNFKNPAGKPSADEPPQTQADSRNQEQPSPENTGQVKDQPQNNFSQQSGFRQNGPNQGSYRQNGFRFPQGNQQPYHAEPQSGSQPFQSDPRGNAQQYQSGPQQTYGQYQQNTQQQGNPQDNWMNNPNLKGMDPEKLKMLNNIANQGSQKGMNELLPFLMSAVSQNKNQSGGLDFSRQEMDTIIEVLKMGKPPEEIARINRMMQIIKMMH